jgi:hypothetical protein
MEEVIGVVPVPNVRAGDHPGEAAAGKQARVLRYKEKRRTRLFSKTIRYEVRKLNAERRPRMKVSSSAFCSHLFLLLLPPPLERSKKTLKPSSSSSSELFYYAYQH